MLFLQNYFAVGALALVVSIFATPLVIKLANKKGWVVKPREDRWHARTTALMGGIAIFISYSLAVLLFEFNAMSITLFCAAGLMFLTGLIDDFYDIKPILKLLAQIVCAFVLLYNGLYFGGGVLGWAGIPLTFFWVIGITNAINLLDNMDGLAAGISTIIALICGVLGILNGELVYAGMSFAMAGAIGGFLIYNFKPAKIFMGDSGSLFIGFSLSFLSIAVQKNAGSSSSILMFLVPISLMAIPIMDTTLVTIKRLIAGRRIDQGGRDHSSHRLVALGLTEKKAVLGLYLISAIWGLLCILMYNTTVNNLLLCLLLLSIFSVIFSFTLSKVQVYNESEEKLTYLRLKGLAQKNNITVRFFLMHKKLMIGIFTDILIIYSSFLIASNVMNISIDGDYIILATFISLKILVFYVTNLYYRMWRYMEMIEIAGYFAFILLASLSLVAVLFLGNKLQHYSLYFFMVDFLITFTGVIFSRMIYRWLNELLSKSRNFEKKVIIYGAGDRGYLLMKELVQNHKHELKIVGWIDDDHTKHHMYLSGTKIFGGKEQLLKTCQRTKANIVMISTSGINEDEEKSLRKMLAENQIEVGRFSVNLSFN
jgi:UDP-GlcNAc:undecaprenyl-phosphate GlcNAc-1-phosphate transferase